MANTTTDTSEDMKYDEAVVLHDDLGAALDIHDDRQLASGSKSEKLKKLVAEFLLDALSLDREKGILMVDSYRTKWLAIMEHPNTEEFFELDKYLAFRRENGGMESVFRAIHHSSSLLTDQYLVHSGQWLALE